MSSLAIGGYFPTFFYRSNALPTWYTTAHPSPFGFAQMNAESMLWGALGAWESTIGASNISYDLEFNGLFSRFGNTLGFMASSFGNSIGALAFNNSTPSYNAAPNYNTGSFGSLTQASASAGGATSTLDAGTHTHPGNAGDAGNAQRPDNSENDALKAENEKLKKQLAAKNKIIAEQQTRLDQNGKKKG